MTNAKKSTVKNSVTTESEEVKGLKNLVRELDEIAEFSKSVNSDLADQALVTYSQVKVVKFIAERLGFSEETVLELFEGNEGFHFCFSGEEGD